MERRQIAMAFTVVVGRLGRQVTSKLLCVPPGVVETISSLWLEDRILRAPDSIRPQKDQGTRCDLEWQLQSRKSVW